MSGPARQRASAAWSSVRRGVGSVMSSAEDGAGQVVQRVGGIFDVIQDRRLRPVLDGEKVTMLPDANGELQTAVRHRVWVGTAGRLIVVGLALVLVAGVVPVVFGAVLVAVGHGVAVTMRRGVQVPAGVVLAVVELVAAFVVYRLFGASGLWLALMLFLCWLALAVVWAWRVDMMLVTSGDRLIRVQGLFLMRRQIAVPLDSIRAASIDFSAFGVGVVSFDSESPKDQMLHGFGLIYRPEQWSALVMARRNAIRHPTSD